jgi:hypothetical protein
MISGLFESDDDEFFEPTHLSEGMDASIKNISVGDFQSLALAEDGTVYSWGAGILGNGTELFSARPVLLPLKKIEMVCVQKNTCLAIGQKVYIWGHVQETKAIVPVELDQPMKPTEIVSADVNTDHVVLASDKSILLMGTNMKYIQPSLPFNPPIMNLPLRKDPVKWPVLFKKECHGVKKVQIKGNQVFVLFRTAN